MAKMRAVQVKNAKGPFELVEREIPKLEKGKALIKVKACGICHSDSFVKEGSFPGIEYPRIPGHEVAGVIEALSPEVKGWKVGQRVGIGWTGGYCHYCNSCRHGDFATCENMQIPGMSYDGGYAEYMLAPSEALALIPDELSFEEAAPLMCAGITTFNALRNAGARPGDLVAVLGIGGLGHLAVQFAAKMGLNTVAIARGKEKEELALKLGARKYIDSQSQNPAKILTELGGAKVILSTVTDSKAIESVIEGLGVNGKLVFVGVSSEPIPVPIFPFIAKRLSLCGWPSGSPMDSQETMSFCGQTGIRSMNKIMPLEQAAEAYDLMMSGKARFRVVLTTERS